MDMITTSLFTDSFNKINDNLLRISKNQTFYVLLYGK